MIIRNETIINAQFIIHIESKVVEEPAGKEFESKAMKLTEKDVRTVYGNDIACMVEQFNVLLKGNPLADKYLPLTEVSIFQRAYEGVILCAMANLLKPGSVDEKEVVVATELLDDSSGGEFLKMGNRNLGITALRLLGVGVDKNEANYIKKETPFRITGLLVQVLRLATLGRVHFTNYDNLVHLFDGWSDAGEAEAILATDREEMILIWVKHQLKKTNTDLELKDFSTGLADCKVYANLLWTVAPEDKKGSLTNPENILKETDPTKRAELVIENASKLGITGAIRPEHIVSAGKNKTTTVKGLHNHLLQVVFLYRIFHLYPNIKAPKAMPAGKTGPEDPLKQYKSACKYGVTADSLIRWLNSFGPSPTVVSLNTDLRNSSVLLQVWDAMIPGSVNWANFKLKNMDSPAKRKFTLEANAFEVIRIAIDNGIPRITAAPSDIVSGDNKNTLSLVYQMMRLHSQLIRKEILGGKATELDDNCLVKWFNEKVKSYGSSFQLANISEPTLKNTSAIGFIGERILVENNLCSSGPRDFPRKSRGSVAETASSTKSAPPTKPKPPPVPPKPKVPSQTSKTAKSGNAASDDQDENADAEDAEDDSELTDAHNSSKWLFPSIEAVDKDSTRFSIIAILMFSKAGILVYASKLGPDTDVSVYRSILLQLNALSTKAN